MLNPGDILEVVEPTSLRLQDDTKVWPGVGDRLTVVGDRLQGDPKHGIHKATLHTEGGETRFLWYEEDAHPWPELFTHWIFEVSP